MVHFRITVRRSSPPRHPSRDPRRPHGGRAAPSVSRPLAPPPLPSSLPPSPVCCVGPWPGGPGGGGPLAFPLLVLGGAGQPWPRWCSLAATVRRGGGSSLVQHGWPRWWWRCRWWLGGDGGAPVLQAQIWALWARSGSGRVCLVASGWPAERLVTEMAAMTPHCCSVAMGASRACVCVRPSLWAVQEGSGGCDLRAAARRRGLYEPRGSAGPVRPGVSLLPCPVGTRRWRWRTSSRWLRCCRPPVPIARCALVVASGRLPSMTVEVVPSRVVVILSDLVYCCFVSGWPALLRWPW